MPAQFLANTKLVASCVISLWFICWSYRRRYELDEKLSYKAKLIRGVIVVICSVIAAVPLPVASRYRIPMVTFHIAALIVCIAFACWPNFATRIFPDKTEVGLE
jgi:hypothetical protein